MIKYDNLLNELKSINETTKYNLNLQFENGFYYIKNGNEDTIFLSWDMNLQIERALQKDNKYAVLECTTRQQLKIYQNF